MDRTAQLFRTALEKLGAFQAGADFSAWLRGIARNCLKRHFEATPASSDEQLLWRHVDGTLCPDEVAQLQKLLQDHPDNGKLLFQFADEFLAVRDAVKRG